MFANIIYETQRSSEDSGQDEEEVQTATQSLSSQKPPPKISHIKKKNLRSQKEIKKLTITVSSDSEEEEEEKCFTYDCAWRISWQATKIYSDTRMIILAPLLSYQDEFTDEMVFSLFHSITIGKATRHATDIFGSNTEVC